jgi:hypothetical protein
MRTDTFRQAYHLTITRVSTYLPSLLEIFEVDDSITVHCQLCQGYACAAIFRILGFQVEFVPRISPGQHQLVWWSIFLAKVDTPLLQRFCVCRL